MSKVPRESQAAAFSPTQYVSKGGNYAAIFISLDVPDSGVRMGIRGSGRFVSSIKVTQESSRMKKYETAKSRKVKKTIQVSWRLQLS